VIPQGVQVFVAIDPVDMRSSFDRLSGIAKEQIGYDARSGALFIFCGRRRDALKILFFDGSGSASSTSGWTETEACSGCRRPRVRARTMSRSATRRSTRCSTESTWRRQPRLRV
jgi:transposase